MNAMSLLIKVCLVSVLSAVLCSAKPTIYVKNENDKLEPVLVPVSSTVIPLPVYKVGFSVGVQQSKHEAETKLITAKKKLPILEKTTKMVSTKEEFPRIKDIEFLRL